VMVLLYPSETVYELGFDSVFVMAFAMASAIPCVLVSEMPFEMVFAI